MMKERIRSAILGSFVGDALSLGVHWIYNTRVIDRKYGRVENLIEPELASFHKGKPKGAFTHYGDQAWLLLESVARDKAFDLSNYAANWQSMFAAYDGYFDKATKDTLANLNAGRSVSSAGSDSSDLGGAARMAPLLLCHGAHLSELIQAARAQTAMTHLHGAVIDAAEFAAGTVYAILNGETPTAALRSSAAAMKGNAFIETCLQQALDSCELDTRQAIYDFGQMCEVAAALPATLHLVVKYEDRFKAAMVENVMAGGDSAARGLMAGMMLGAYHGKAAIPSDWLHEMIRYDAIVECMDRVLAAH